MMKKFIAVLLSISLIAVSAGCDSQASNHQEEWGRADAKEIDVNSKVSGRVVELLVKEGDEVKAGQIIARIDKRDLEAKKKEIEAEISAAEAQREQAAQVTSMQSGTTKSALKEAESAEEKAQSALALAEADYHRYSDLLEQEAISEQVFEQYKTKYQEAQAAYNQSAAAVAQASAALGQTAVDQSNEAAAQRKIEACRAQLEQVEVSLDETEIKAPYDGVITQKYVEEGSMISTGTPIAAVQDPEDNWVDIKIPETQLSKYYVGQDVALIARDGKTKVKGKITDISKKAEFATERATSERGDATDIVSFNMKVQVNDSFLRPGMRFRLAGDEE